MENFYGANPGLFDYMGDVRHLAAGRRKRVCEKRQNSPFKYCFNAGKQEITTTGFTKMPISKMVAYYKKTARIALKATGLTGKVWAKGYDKRFCFDQASVQQRIEYVQKHNQNI